MLEKARPRYIEPLSCVFTCSHQRERHLLLECLWTTFSPSDIDPRVTTWAPNSRCLLDLCGAGSWRSCFRGTEPVFARSWGGGDGEGRGLEPGRGQCEWLEAHGELGNSYLSPFWKYFSISTTGTAVPAWLADSGPASTVHLLMGKEHWRN